jgi:uncharacterized protein YbcV (DUF1398 family)
MERGSARARSDGITANEKGNNLNTDIVIETARKTLDGSIAFPEVVSQLLAAGVEYYHVDYIGMKKTFYSADGAMAVTPINYEGMPPVASEFSLEGIRADILDSQRNGQPYRDFTRRAMEAGVQGYFAFLRGRRVTYLGRQGDQHIEWFPGAQPAVLTAETLRAIYSRPRTGADFPALVRELKSVGIVSYDHVIETGANVFHGKNGETLTLPNMGPAHPVSDRPNLDALKKIISEHQRGLSNYPELCRLVGEVGVEKWVCDLRAMTCSYFDKAGHKMHVEQIPTGEYKH